MRRSISRQVLGYSRIFTEVPIQRFVATQFFDGNSPCRYVSQ